MWQAIDASFAAVFARLPEIDLALPARVTGADVAKLTPKARGEITEAVAAAAVCRAAVKLSAAVVARQLGVQVEPLDAEIARIAELDVPTWRRFKDGLNLRQKPRDGSTVFTWLARCGAVPSIRAVFSNVRRGSTRYAPRLRSRTSGRSPPGISSISGSAPSPRRTLLIMPVTANVRGRRRKPLDVRV